MKATLLFVLILLSALPAQSTQALGFANVANQGICVARSGSAVVGWYCSSGYSQIVLTDHVRFGGTNLCLHANTPTTLMVATCADTPRQRFYHIWQNGPIYNALYGPNQKLYWSGSLGSTIGMTNSYPSHPTRNWVRR